MSPLDACPAPPDWRLDWDQLCADHSWVAALHDCPQDPENDPDLDDGGKGDAFMVRFQVDF